MFTRVGAGDNLARGESTFMVEMRETAHILRHATARSLIVLDEIGRGTSTYDGVSIAWAVAEHLHDRVGAKTLFATHYHELGALAASHAARAQRQSVAAREWKGEVVFLRKLTAGGASRSFGIEVAKLAGLPPAGGRAGARHPAHARVGRRPGRGRRAAARGAGRRGGERPARAVLSATAAAAGIPERALSEVVARLKARRSRRAVAPRRPRAHCRAGKADRGSGELCQEIDAELLAWL